MNRIMLSPWPFAVLATIMAALGGAQLIYSGRLNGVADLTIGGALLMFVGLRATLLRIGMRIGFEAGRAHGRLLARAAMFESLQEAQLRGMTPTQWVESELERDLEGL